MGVKMAKLYSINQNYPVNFLPQRLRLSNGNTRTDYKNFDKLTAKELKDANVVEVDPPPSISATQTLSWSGTKWVVKDFPKEDIEVRTAKQWEVVREQRDELISIQSKYIEQYLSEVRRGVTPTIDIAVVDKYVEELRQVPQKNTDPFNIDWPEDWAAKDGGYGG